MLNKSDLPKELKENEIIKLRKITFGKYDKQLDGNPFGACHMNEPAVAKIIYDKIMNTMGCILN